MKSQLKPILIGAVAGPFIFLLIAVCLSSIMQVLWSTQSWSIGTQIFNAVTWGALLGAITFNIYSHYKNNNFTRAKQLGLIFGVSLSLIFLVGLMYRLYSLSSFALLSTAGLPVHNPSKVRWLSLAYFESVSLHWSLTLLLFSLWLPKRTALKP
jgi:hypothetical protein